MSPAPQGGPVLPYAALILGAGRSSRMGASKPLLPLAGQTLIERVVGLFKGVGVGQIVVVLGHEAGQLLPLLGRLGVVPVVNPRYDEGMFTSVQAGVGRLDRDCRAFFLLPVDIPLVGPGTLHALAEAFQKMGVDVCRPVFQGRYGHPPLIAATLIPAILDFDGAGGLRALLARYRDRTADVAVEDPGILMDLDTREDYEAALKILADPGQNPPASGCPGPR
ncbi:MAG: nucleotidyltransferase family protein [Deltaproteobacteria bacterium]|nr:nucleotidyltransferase family protein [Deltaproteobacteria bacterium]